MTNTQDPEAARIAEAPDETQLALSQPYYVYILRCRGDRLYTGVTNDPKRRFSEHDGTARGAKFTRAFRPEAIAALWETDSRSLAQKLEARIKRLSRMQKDRLIRQDMLELFGGAVDPDAYRRIR